MKSTTRTTAAIAGLFVASAAAQNSTSTCASGVHLIVARGSIEPAGVGQIGSVANGVVAAIPGSQIEPLDYPATFDNYSTSVEDGDIAMNLALTAYSSRCPDSKVALLGYSQVRERAVCLSLIEEFMTCMTRLGTRRHSWGAVGGPTDNDWTPTCDEAALFAFFFPLTCMNAGCASDG